MLKLIGSLLVIGASTAVGFALAGKLYKRSHTLEGIIFALRLLETEISYGKRDIKTIMHEIGKSQGIELFTMAANMINDKGIRGAIEDALDSCDTILGTDKMPIRVLAENLGMTDTQSQISAIRSARKSLTEAQREAAAEYAKSARLYRNAGALGGIFAVILLL